MTRGQIFIFQLNKYVLIQNYRKKSYFYYIIFELFNDTHFIEYITYNSLWINKNCRKMKRDTFKTLLLCTLLIYTLFLCEQKKNKFYENKKSKRPISEE